MSNTSIIMLGDTNGQFEVTGDMVRGDGYYGFSDGNHTISVHLNNFTGRIWLEGSLAHEPRDNDCSMQFDTESDWFPINLTTCVPYLDFEQETGSYAYTFQGNFVWLRARLDRSHIQPEPDNDDDLAQLGVIRKVLLNH